MRLDANEIEVLRKGVTGFGRELVRGTKGSVFVPPGTFDLEVGAVSCPRNANELQIKAKTRKTSSYPFG